MKTQPVIGAEKNPDPRTGLGRPTASLEAPGARRPSCADKRALPLPPFDDSRRLVGAARPDAVVRPRLRNLDMQRALKTGDRSAEVCAWYVQQARQRRMKRRAQLELRAIRTTPHSPCGEAARAAPQPRLRPANRPAPAQGQSILRSSAGVAWRRLRTWWAAIMQRGGHHD